MAGDLISTVAIVTSLTDEQAKAVQSVSEFGTTVVKESGDLARYIGRVVGTVPEDAVGLVIGDPLRAVRTAAARSYDILLTKIFGERGVKNPQPASPSYAIPLLRAAYDETRPDLQELWARLLASAMDPLRAGRVRLGFIETLKRFDPLDAVVLKIRYEHPEEMRVSGSNQPNAASNIAERLGQPLMEVQLSIDNLKVLNCAAWVNPSPTEFYVTNYGKALVQACMT
jgi:hypothetical protein